MRFPFAALLMAAALLTSARTSAAREYGWTISPLGGYGQFSNRLFYPADSLADAPLFGLRLGRSLGEYWTLEAGGTYSTTHELRRAGTDGLDVKFFNVSASLLAQLTPLNRFGSLYLAGGGGYDRFKADAVSYYKSAYTIEVAAGWQKPLNDAVWLRLEARNVLNVPDQRLTGANQADQQYWGGLTFAFGGTPKDTDGDGVSDKHDDCPDTPKGAMVNAMGCPTDADGDGVFDGLDQCPNTPKGASVDAKGCPSDADGDGVFNGVDQCPDTPKGASVDAKGCPGDADGDGVPDGLDRCPGTPAGLKVDSDGCPIEVTEKETQLLDTGMIRLQDVNFETGKSALLPESFAALDEVGSILVKWPQLKIEVGGHTDSRGSAGLNQALSEARAQAVREYLVGKFGGLDPNQLTGKGYGAAKPVAPNTSPLNMAKNRRVEFKVLNRDALKKEVERRRMLKK